MTNTKWNVQIGDRRQAISSDLLIVLGFSAPYTNDETQTARGNESAWDYHGPLTRLAEGYAHGLSGDEAAMYAIRLMNERRAEQSLQTARQKIAELEAKAAADHRAAEGMALSRRKSSESD